MRRGCGAPPAMRAADTDTVYHRPGERSVTTTSSRGVARSALRDTTAEVGRVEQ